MASVKADAPASPILFLTKLSKQA